MPAQLSEVMKKCYAKCPADERHKRQYKKGTKKKEIVFMWVKEGKGGMVSALFAEKFIMKDRNPVF